MLIVLQDVLIREIDEKIVLGHWKGSKTLWIDRKLANLKKEEQMDESSSILGHQPNNFLTPSQAISN